MTIEEREYIRREIDRRTRLKLIRQGIIQEQANRAERLLEGTCRNGHPREGNLVWFRNEVRCKACRREHNRRYRAKQRGPA